MNMSKLNDGRFHYRNSRDEWVKLLWRWSVPDQTARMHRLIWASLSLYAQKRYFPISAAELNGSRQTKSCFRACAKCADSHRLAHAQSHPGICSPLKHSIVSNDSVSGQWRPWSDCAHAQADLGLCCRICPKTRFRMGRTKYRSVGQISRLSYVH